MRPLSMTAFGRGESNDGIRNWVVEIRSVNHRYCDINIKISREYAGMEERVRKVIQAFYTRGKIDVVIAFKGGDPTASSVTPNLHYARQYYESLVAISRDLGLLETPDLALLALNKDIISQDTVGGEIEVLWPSVQQAVHEALERGLAMRAREGLSLKEELLNRLQLLEGHVAIIEKNMPDLITTKEKNLRERLAVLLREVALDPARLAQEVAILTEKADTTEELVRLGSHIKQFRFFLDCDEPVGRRLDFLMQEFLREINTIASKIGDAAIAHQTVEMKNEVEKLREQVQNLE